MTSEHHKQSGLEQEDFDERKKSTLVLLHPEATDEEIDEFIATLQKAAEE